MNEQQQAFAATKQTIDDMLKRLADHSENHFGLHPDEVTWAHVGRLEHYTDLLKQISDIAFRKGEYSDGPVASRHALTAAGIRDEADRLYREARAKRLAGWAPRRLQREVEEAELIGRAMDDEANAIADRIKAAMDTGEDDGWISVLDSLPDDLEIVMVTAVELDPAPDNATDADAGEVFTDVYRESEQWWHDGSAQAVGMTVTHWRPFPDPARFDAAQLKRMLEAI